MKKTRKKETSMMQALGYEAIAWIWAGHQATTLVGEDLIFAIADKDNRTLQSIFDEVEIHEALHDDHLFSAFMIACGLHADREAWAIVKSFGYNLDSTFRVPVLDKDGSFLGLEDKETRLGFWVADFCSMDTILERSYEMGWALFNIRDRRDPRPVIGCEQRLTRSGERGWLGLWQAQYNKTIEAEREISIRRSGIDSFVLTKRAKDIPPVIFSLDDWVRKSRERGDVEASAHGQMMVDEMILTWARQSYWPNNDADLWTSFWRDPPLGGPPSETHHISFIKEVSRILQTVAPVENCRMEGMYDALTCLVRSGRHVEPIALIEMGAPISRGEEQLGDYLVHKALIDPKGNIHPKLFDAWKARADVEGARAWDRLPQFVKDMPMRQARVKAQKEATFRDMLVMSLETEPKVVAQAPARRF